MALVCAQCGQTNIDGARFCEACGGKLEAPGAAPPAGSAPPAGAPIDPFATQMWSGTATPTGPAAAPPPPPAPAPPPSAPIGMSADVGMSAPPSPFANVEDDDEVTTIPPPVIPNLAPPPPPPATFAAPPPPPPPAYDNPMGGLTPVAPMASVPPPPPAYGAPPPPPPPPAGYGAPPPPPPSYGAPPPPPPSYGAPPPPPPGNMAPPPPSFAAPPPPPPAAGGYGGDRPPMGGGGYGGGGGSTAGRDPHPVPANMGWIGEGWALLSSDFGGWIMLMLPMIVAAIALSVISAVTAGIGGILGLAMGPIAAATCGAMLLKARSGQNTEFAQIYQNAMPILVPGIVFSIITSIAISCGMALCFVPGLFCMTAAYFGMFQIGDGDTDFMQPFMRGIEVAKADIGGYLLLNFVLVLIGSFGITIPLVAMVYLLAYRANYE